MANSIPFIIFFVKRIRNANLDSTVSRKVFTVEFTEHAERQVSAKGSNL